MKRTDQPYMQATGVLPHSLVNDYMFKALLQKNQVVLKHLICSMLHLRPEEVVSVDLRNPIVLGKSLAEDFDSKTFVLDVNVLLNNQVLINLEMQVVNYKNWPERSLTYLCRNFDQLSRGEDYIHVKPVVHIGFLDFTLFKESPEFYATYKMMNEKNHQVYTDKFILSVVDLNHIELATREDREWKIDYWASLFKATTWEELKMLAEQNSILEGAVETIYELTADETVQEQCKAREKHVREMRTVLTEKEMAVQEKEMAVQEKEMAVQEKEMAVQEKEMAIQEKEMAMQEKDKAVQEKEKILQESEQEIAQLRQKIEQLTQENRQLQEQRVPKQ